MSDDWDYFPLRVDDHPASIFVDLGVRKQAPILSHPTMAYLRVLMLKPREDGLSSQDEFEDLIDLEDKVTSKITRDGTCLFVGRNTSSGNRDFYFYTSDSTGFETIVREAMRDFPTYSYKTGSRVDRDWQTYFEFLYPSERSMQLIMNRRVREQLEENGDNLNNERQIDHLVLVPSKESQLKFARDIADEGFNINRAPSKPDDNGQYPIEFSRKDSPSEIDNIVLSLFDKVTGLGGAYDGWGCHTAP